MERTNKKLIAVIGATGQQGAAVVRALQAGSEFRVRVLSRNPGKHRELAEEVVQADLDRPETLKAAFDLPSPYVLRCGFVRANCARKQNSRQAAEQVFGVGSTECPGSETLNAFCAGRSLLRMKLYEVTEPKSIDSLKLTERPTRDPVPARL
jgi:NAD(P)-dependent dehydrogenase (short-subunit alcohol dehydrogenase family)